MFSFASRSVLARPHKTAWCVMPGMLPFPSIAPFAHTDNASANMTLPAVTVNAKSNSAGASNTVAPTLDPNLPASIETITHGQFNNWNAVNSEDALKYRPNLAMVTLTE